MSTVDRSQLIQVLDAAAGRFQVQDVQGVPNRVPVPESMIPYPRTAKGRITVDPLDLYSQEATRQLFGETKGTLSTFNFPDYLRMGLIFDAFTSYNELPVTFPMFVRQVDSNKQQEEYVKDTPLGTLPIVPEGQSYPEASMDTSDGVTIRNYKRGYIVSVTEEMQKFDQVGKVREIAELQGRSARLSEELAVIDVLTTTANYTRNSTTGDNDEGANTQTLTFSPTGLIAAYNVLTTMKDRKTGVRLGVMPDTLIIAPKLRWAAEQLIRSPQLMRVGGNTTNDVYGGGTNNPFFGMVTRIIVCPHLGSSYQWALLESNRAITFQRVEPFTILREQMDASSSAYFERDTIRFRVRDWFGVGMRDDRFAFFSNSTTAPAVN